MNEAHDPDRHKAVLAAVLAVQRGFLSPDEAVRVLADLPKGESGAMQTLLSVTPSSAHAEIESQVEELASRPGSESEALTRLGISEQAQQTLVSLRPTEKTQIEEATEAISSVAQSDRVKAMTRRLPSASSSGRYTVKHEFARGGMGRIFVALDNAVGREVALKELLSSAAGSSSSSGGPEIIERFLREAKVTGQLEHPNIVPVYEIATREDGSVFYTMKLVRGKTMAHRLQTIQNGAGSEQQKLDQRLKLLDAFTDVCNAIAYAHSRGVIHRDLKPANIMLGDFGETLVLDWGLARVRGQDDSSTVRKQADPFDVAQDRPFDGAQGGPADEAEGGPFDQAQDRHAFSPSLVDDASDARTIDGAILGTPAYMPPEQARGEMDVVDERADVYALGAILYEILAGRPPYEGKNARDVLAKVLVLEPDSLSKVASLAPPDLVTLTEKAMARDPDRRLKSADELGREVLAFRDGRTLSVYRYSTGELVRRFVKRHRAAVSVAVVAFLLIVAGTVIAFNSIAGERDTAEQNLRIAQNEKRARIELQRRQEEKRQKLIDARYEEIEAQRDLIDNQRGSDLRGEAQGRIREMRERGELTGGLPPVDRAVNSRLVQGLLKEAALRSDLLRLLTEPVAGMSHQFVPLEVYDEEVALLVETRLLAATLAQLNQDFAMAEFIVRGTRLDESRSAELLGDIDQARNALLKRHADQIEGALAEVRKDLGRVEGGYTVEDFVLQLSAYREQQTVDMLSQALHPYIERAGASDEAQFWTQPERDEITLCCRVLAHLELPQFTVPALGELMEALDDDRLAIECGTALCITGHRSAWQPLVSARERFGPDSYTWRQIAKRITRVPEPAELPPAETVEELLERARVRNDFGNPEGAVEDIEAALELEPDNPDVLVARGRMMHVQYPGGFVESSQALFDRALELNPDHAGAHMGRAMNLQRMEKMDEAIASVTRVTELDPDNFRAFHYLGFLLQMSGRYEEAVEANSRAIELYPWSASLFANRAANYYSMGEYEKALADCNRSIDLDPRHNEAWINRGVVKIELGLYEAAVADLTRLLEIWPGHAWGYLNRGRARLEMEDYEGAIYDFTMTLKTHAQFLPNAYVFRARCYKATGRDKEAVSDARNYLQHFTEGELADEARAIIAELEG